MAGSVMKSRKGLRPLPKGQTQPQEQPVSQHQTSGSKPKSMLSGESRPTSAWAK